MLKKQMEAYIKKEVNRLFKEERVYAEKHQLIPDNYIIEEKGEEERFLDAYLELSDKESEDLLSEESADFLNKPISFLKENKQAFLYIESADFNVLGVENLSLELDDVFGTYNALFSLKMPKKAEQNIKDFLNKHLSLDMGAYSVMFNQGDGAWDVNFALDGMEDFHDSITLKDAFVLIYRFLFTMEETIEEEM